MGLYSRLQQWEKQWHSRFDNLPDTPEGARKSTFYMRWLDHEALRIFWSNRYQVAPDVWRGNHPTPKGWRHLQKMGIKSVLNLRAESAKPFYQIEKRTCAALGFTLVSVPLAARKAPETDRLLRLLEAFRTIERPFFMHCKSGADRTGLASAIYLLVIEGATVAQARRMFSRRFVHLKSTKTGVLDAFLDAYEEDGGDFEDWLRNRYDSAALQARFDARRKGQTA